MTKLAAAKHSDPRPTRERLIAAMLDALQRRGLHGIGLNELLAAAKAPKGVLYHHFPGGKTELALAAIAHAISRLSASLVQMIEAGNSPTEILSAWMLGAQRRLESSGFERGCPLATIALESTGGDAAIRQRLSQGFAELRRQLARMLRQGGVAESRAEPLASLILSSYEGALIQARVAADAQPLLETSAMLIALVQAEIACGGQPK
jgi:TetR/AcrR family transcriptional repressor of lmrAB and yxaGH operons